MAPIKEKKEPIEWGQLLGSVHAPWTQRVWKETQQVHHFSSVPPWGPPGRLWWDRSTKRSHSIFPGIPIVSQARSWLIFKVWATAYRALQQHLMSPVNRDGNQRRLEFLAMRNFSNYHQKASLFIVKHSTTFKNGMFTGSYNLRRTFHSYMCYSKTTFYSTVF